MWKTYMVTLVRALSGEFDSSTMPNLRVQQAIVAAAHMAVNEYSFSTDYVLDIETPEITPDPVVINDQEAIALFSLRAACILAMNNLNSALKCAVEITQGDDKVNTTGRLTGYKDIIAMGPCKSYDAMIKDLSSGNIARIAKAVLTPYSHENFSPTYHARSFFDGFLGNCRS
jgi:hypothetical protein